MPFEEDGTSGGLEDVWDDRADDPHDELDREWKARKERCWNVRPSRCTVNVCMTSISRHPVSRIGKGNSEWEGNLDEVFFWAGTDDTRPYSLTVLGVSFRKDTGRAWTMGES